jgi:glycosyltransferase involved in cell wall biosynthesis
MQVQTNDLALAMMERGHEVMVASGPPQVDLDPKIPFAALPDFERRFLGGRSFISALRKLVVDFNPEVIQGRGLRLCPAIRLSAQGRGATVTYAGMPEGDRRRAAYLARFSGLPVSSVGKSPSDELAAFGLESSVLPLIVAPAAQAYERRALLEGLGLDPSKPVALFAGRFVDQKNPLAIPAVMAAAPSWSLLIAGRGPLGDVLEHDLASRGLLDRVKLLGWRDDVERLMASADAFLSTANWEGYGGSVLEAHVAGTPIVAFAAPGVREVVQEGNSGLLIPMGDSPGLGAALERLAADDDLAKRLRQGGPAIAAECLPDASVAANLHYYAVLIQQSRRGR